MFRFPVAVDAVGEFLGRKLVLIVDDDRLECLPELDATILALAIGGKRDRDVLARDATARVKFLDKR